MMKTTHIPFARNIFFHAFMPPLIIFGVLSVGLWGSSDGLDFPLTIAIFIVSAP